MSNPLSGMRFLLVQGGEILAVFIIVNWSDYPTEKSFEHVLTETALKSDNKKEFALGQIKRCSIDINALHNDVLTGRMVPVGETKESVLEKINLVAPVAA